MPKWYKDYKHRLNEPIMVDHGIDVMAGCMWLLYGVWGILASLAKLITLTQVVGTDYTIPWSATIAACSLVAGLAAVSTVTRVSVFSLILRKQIELWTVCILGGLISVYPVLLIVRAVFESEPSIYAQVALALSLVVFPTWRIRHLVKRIRGLRSARSSLG